MIANVDFGLRVSPGARLSLLDQERRDEDGEQEYQLNECEGDEHRRLQFANCLWLSSHTLQACATNQSKSNSNAKRGDADANS